MVHVHVLVGNLKGFLYVLTQRFFCVVLREFMPTGSSSADVGSCQEELLWESVAQMYGSSHVML